MLYLFIGRGEGRGKVSVVSHRGILTYLFVKYISQDCLFAIKRQLLPEVKLDRKKIGTF